MCFLYIFVTDLSKRKKCPTRRNPFMYVHRLVEDAKAHLEKTLLFQVVHFPGGLYKFREDLI